MISEIKSVVVIVAVLLQPYTVRGDHDLRSSMSFKESDGRVNISPLSTQNVLLFLMKGNSTSPSFISNPVIESSQETSFSLSLSASSLNSNKFVSVPRREKSNGIISYSSLLPASNVQWMNDFSKRPFIEEVDDVDDHGISTSTPYEHHLPTDDVERPKPDKKNIVKITPLQEELIFVIQNNPDDEQSELGDTQMEEDRIALFEKHVNDPDFILSQNSGKISLIIPLTPGSISFEKLSVLCNDDDAVNDDKAYYEESDDNRVSKVYSQEVNFDIRRNRNMNVFSDNPYATSASHDKGTRSQKLKIKKFHLVSHLLKFKWTDIDMSDEDSSTEKALEKALGGKNGNAIWLTSCPKNIACVEESKPLLLPSTSKLQISNTSVYSSYYYNKEFLKPKLSGGGSGASTSFVHHQSEISTTSATLTTSSTADTSRTSTTSATTNVKRRMVKVSQSEAFTVVHECRNKMQTLNDKAHTQPFMKNSKPIPNISDYGNNNMNITLLIVDLYPVFQFWLRPHQACLGQVDFSRTFVFSLNAEEITGRGSPYTSKPSPTKLFSSSVNSPEPTTAPDAFPGLRISSGDEQAFLSVEYKIDGKWLSRRTLL